MASIKKAPKKGIKTLDCGRCGLPTTHTLYDAENKIYKCTICGSVIKL